MYAFIVHGAAAHTGLMQQAISGSFQENSWHGPKGHATCLACVVSGWGLPWWAGWWPMGNMVALCLQVCAPVHCVCKWPEEANFLAKFSNVAPLGRIRPLIQAHGGPQPMWCPFEGVWDGPSPCNGGLGGFGPGQVTP